MSYSQTFLQRVVNTLLPGLPAEDNKPAIPSASTVGIDKELAAHLETNPLLQQALQRLCALANGEDAFVQVNEEVATAVMSQLAEQEPTAFQSLLFIVKADYYEHEVVLRAFQWPTTPPQPSGYPLSSRLNEAQLDEVKKQGFIWRSA